MAARSTPPAEAATGARALRTGATRLFFVGEGIVEPVACAADREAFLVQQLADAADQQHFVMLVIAAVAAPLHGLQLREFLLPIAKHVRLHPAKIAYLTDGEVALGGDRR